MSQVNSNVPEDGFRSKKDFMDKGQINDSDLTVVNTPDATKKLLVDLSKSATAGTNTLVPSGSGRLALQSSSSAGSTAFVGLGTVTNNFVNVTIIGNLMYCQGKCTAGTTTAVAMKITLPVAYTIDTTKLPAGNFKCGDLVTQHLTTATRGDIFFDGTIATDLFISLAAASADFVKSLGNAVIATGDNVYFQFIVPVTGH